MSQSTKIEWTDMTWNPTTGCTRVSAGCDNCYAAKTTKRLQTANPARFGGLIGKGHFNGKIRMHEKTLLEPLKWRKSRGLVFVNSMSDLFHKDVPFGFIDKVFAVMALTPHTTFQILTKRPERMAEYFKRTQTSDEFIDNLSWICDVKPKLNLNDTSLRIEDGYRWTLPNVWLGASVEDQATWDERSRHLRNCPTAVRFISHEPALGPIDFRSGLEGLDWLICGGESGPGARPMHPDWARQARDQCFAAGVPYFFKQWGEYMPLRDWQRREQDDPEGPTFETMPKDLIKPVSPYEDFLDTRAGVIYEMARVGKKRAGRLLDGREWSEMPEAST